MDKLKNYLLATGCLVVLAGALTLMGPAVLQGREGPRPKDVNVVNTPENPVPVVVQNGDMNGTTRQLVDFFEPAVTLGTRIDLFTVPAGQRLLITDVIISALGAAVVNARILRDGVVISRLNVPTAPNGTYEHSYISGIVFREDETLGIIGGEGGSTSNWELRGFLETLPPS